MCAMGAWAKAEQIPAAHRRRGGRGFAERVSRSLLELAGARGEDALANSAGMGLPAAREAGEKAVDAVRGARARGGGRRFDHMDAVVQLDAPSRTRTCRPSRPDAALHGGGGRLEPRTSSRPGRGG